MGMPLFHKDKMTYEERTHAFMAHQPTDRVPLMILAMAFNGVNAGYTINEWYTDPKVSFESGRMTAELYGANWLPFGGYPGIGPWEFGGEMKMPKGEFP